MFFDLVYAADASAQAATPASMISAFLPFIILIVFFWLLIIRPQKKRDKQMKEMLAAIKVGDKVVTIGGIVGTIAKIKDDTVTIETGVDKTKIVFERRAIATVESKVQA